MVDSDRISRAFAAYAVADFGEIDPEVVHQARLRILEAISVAFIGMDPKAHPATGAVLEYARRYVRDDGPSRIWGTGLAAPADVAGLANGVFLRNADGNDSYFGPATNVHPSDAIPAIVAVAEEEGLSGRQVLDAVLVSYEASVTSCDCWPDLSDRGWDQTNHVQVATVVGLGRLLGLSQQEVENALGMAVVPRLGMLQAREGRPSSWKSFSGSDAARHALFACRLAQAGGEGPNEPFEGTAAFLKQTGYAYPEEALKSILELRPPARVLDTNIKYAPVASPIQSATHAASLVHGQLEDGERVVDVTVTTYERAAVQMANEARRTPTSRKTATHSLPYVVLVALEDGHIYGAFDDLDRITGESTHAFIRDHIEVTSSAEMDAIFPDRMPASVEVVTDRGRRLSEYVEAAPGFVGNPVTDAQLEDKFRNCTRERLGEARCEEAIEVLRNLEELDDLGTLTQLLAS